MCEIASDPLKVDYTLMSTNSRNIRLLQCIHDSIGGDSIPKWRYLK